MSDVEDKRNQKQADELKASFKKFRDAGGQMSVECSQDGGVKFVATAGNGFRVGLNLSWEAVFALTCNDGAADGGGR